jgi:hypothetical protein
MKKPRPYEEPVTLSRQELHCPHCGGTDMKVQNIWANFPADVITVGLATDPLRVIQLDDGGGHAWITLIVYCAGCDREIDLYLREGQIRPQGSLATARAVWGNLG